MFPDSVSAASEWVSRPRFIDLMPVSEAAEGLVGSEHSTTFLVFLARGAGVARIADTVWPLQRGAACISHQQPEVLGPVLRGWTLSLAWEQAENGDDPISISEGVRILPTGLAGRCEGFFEMLETELDRGEERVSLVVVHALVELILKCYERSPLSNQGRERASGARGTRAQLLVDEIMDVIDSRFGERLSLVDVAAALNRSSSSLSRAAQTVTGRTVGELIAERRINEAQRLLNDSALPIDQIAAQVGYPSTGHFHRAFRRSTSMTPRRWRDEASRVFAHVGDSVG